MFQEITLDIVEDYVEIYNYKTTVEIINSSNLELVKKRLSRFLDEDEILEFLRFSLQNLRANIVDNRVEREYFKDFTKIVLHIFNNKDYNTLKIAFKYIVQTMKYYMDEDFGNIILIEDVELLPLNVMYILKDIIIDDYTNIEVTYFKLEEY